MGQYFSGQHGQIYVKPEDGTPPGGDVNTNLEKVGSLRDWQLSMSMGVLDSTTMEMTDRTLLHGVRSYNGSATMLYYREDGSISSNIKRIIQTSFFATSNTDVKSSTFGENTQPEMATLKLRLWQNPNEYDIDCVCYITAFSIQCAVGDVVSASISFEGHGLPTNMDMIK